jgi:hypothetical protein
VERTVGGICGCAKRNCRDSTWLFQKPTLVQCLVADPTKLTRRRRLFTLDEP